MLDGNKVTDPMIEVEPGPAPGSEEAKAEAEALNLEADAPTLATAYTLADLEADRLRGLISLARLPRWPLAHGTDADLPDGEADHGFGHGIGEHLANALGGGLRPGEIVVVGAASAGAGKTAWLMQTAEGLAARNGRILGGESEWGDALTPVLVASELGADALTWRSLARWTGHRASIFRGGRTYAERSPEHAARADRAWADARAALAGELGEVRGWLRLLSPRAAMGKLASGGPKALAAHMVALVERWRAELAKKHGREVVPAVVLDPVQRYQGADDEVRALNELALELRAAVVEHGWIAFVTSDTNKNAAKGDGPEGDQEWAASVLRGSYQLVHEATATIALRRPKGIDMPAEAAEKGARYVEAVIGKARWGHASRPWPLYVWMGGTGRFYPLTEQEARTKNDEAAKAGNEGEPPARAGKGKNGGQRNAADAFRSR